MQVWASMLAAFITSLAGCWLITRSSILKTIGAVAPSENRWHVHATPGLGGIAIFIALCFAVVTSTDSSSLSAVILASAFPLLILGTYDDLKSLSPAIKLLGQIGSSLLFFVLATFVQLDIDISAITGLWRAGENFVANPISFVYLSIFIFWIVAIINAFNLLDNMDGLAGGIALIACIGIAFIARQTPELMEISSFYLTLSAALAGFLILNHNPAKLFMGDAGALWIGLVVAIGTLLIVPTYTISTQTSSAVSHSYHWIVPLIICTVPISDTLMVIVTRKLRGQPASVGGKDHLSHRLVSLGLSERMSVTSLWLLSALATILALLIVSVPPTVWFFPLVAYLFAVVTAVAWLTRVTSAPGGIAQKNTKLNSL